MTAPAAAGGHLPDELVMAIGLVWGHLSVRQFEPARRLGAVCLRLWPHDARLALMVAYARVELRQPLGQAELAALATVPCPGWAAMLAQRNGAAHMQVKPGATGC